MWPIKLHRPVTFYAACPHYWALIVIVINNRRVAVRYAGEVNRDTASVYIEGPQGGFLQVGKQAEWDRA